MINIIILNYFNKMKVEIINFLIGIVIGIISLKFIKSSNYTENLIKDIKSDLNIDLINNKE